MITPSHPIEAPPPAEQFQQVTPRQHWQTLGYVMAGTFLIWLVLDRSAAWLGSLSGEAGLLVCAIVIITALGVERLLFKIDFWRGAKRLGLGYPGPRVMLVTLGVSLLMLAFYPLFSFITGAPVSLRSGWLWLALGLFAQHGIAEEMLFRGFTFGHLREGRTFWRAAFLSLIPFVAVHLLLLASLDLPLALASISLAVAVSLPFSYLFDRGYRTIWAPALLHFITHTIKLVVIPAPFYLPAAVAWMAICGLLPYLVFVLLPKYQPPINPSDTPFGN